MPRNPGQPKYLRIADSLRHELLAAGDSQPRVPSERELAARFGVARNTARRALEHLREAGLIGRIQGSGSYATGRRDRVIYGLVPLADIPRFATLFRWIARGLNDAGYSLILLESGQNGEHLLSDVDAGLLNAADGLIWLPPHPRRGHDRAVRFRRQLARRLPMVLVTEDLGVSLQGVHRVDLVHFDWLLSAERLLMEAWQDGVRHPVLGLWDDLTSFALDQLRLGFTAALRARGVADPESHVWAWSKTDPGSLASYFEAALTAGWSPDMVVLHPEQATVFRRDCRRIGWALAPDLPIISSQDEEGQLYMPDRFRQTATICVDLMLSRLQNPTRPNMRVAVNVPIRRRRNRLRTSSADRPA